MNKVIELGRLTKDVELRYVGEKNSAVCSFTIAVDRKFKGKDGNKETDFFSCQAWGAKAEFISKCFQKGVRILVEGRLQNRTWDDKDGNKRYATEIIVEEVDFADGKRDGQGSTSIGFAVNVDYPEEIDNDELPF